jgi:Uma2 family endonuclease
MLAIAMTTAARAPERRYDEYLSIEQSADRKHEWVDGLVLAMAGGTPAHNQLSAQVIVELARVIDERPCRVFTSDQRVRATDGRFASYADVAVVCGDPNLHPEDVNAITNPLILVEVLSDGTEAWDRSGTIRRDRRFASLRHYVLLSQHEPLVEVYTRVDEEGWTLREFGPGERAALSALDGALSVDRLYRGVVLESTPARG